MASKYEKSCGIIPFKLEDGVVKFLLVKKPDGQWHFPRGCQEKGEGDRQTAVRELKEETNLRPKKLLDGTYYKHYYYFWKGKKQPKQIYYFLGYVPTGKVVLQAEELVDQVWLTYRTALEKLTYKALRDILKEAKPELDLFVKSIS